MHETTAMPDGGPPRRHGRGQAPARYRRTYHAGMTVLARAARSRWPELPVELAIAAVVAATTVLAVWTELRWSPYPIRAAGWAYACAAVAAGALVARRRRPVAVLAVG